MQNLLSTITHKVNEAKDLHHALRIIVTQIKKALNVDVCSVYLIDDKTSELVLMASDGLLSESNRTVRLRFNKGIVGLVAERSEPVNIANAYKHPRYHYFSETGEEIYRAFLGVPIIHQSKLIGVLVLQQSKASKFKEDIVTFLTTISVQIASSISHIKHLDNINSVVKNANIPSGITLKGVPGATGIGIGIAVVIVQTNKIETIPDKKIIDVTVEKLRFIKAVQSVKQETQELLRNISTVLPETYSALFKAYLLMLESNTLVGAVESGISSGNWAPGALRQVIMNHIHTFSEMDDPYLQQRAEDVRDLGNRILQHLNQELEETSIYPDKVILVGEEISASNLAKIPTDKLAGIISLKGSATSHAAILASALGIPAILGIEDLPITLINGLNIITDGYAGNVYINPDKSVIKKFKQLQDEDKLLQKTLWKFRDLRSETSDGVHIPIYANTGLISDLMPAINSGAEGVGLFRTEFTFLEKEFFPGEHEQQDLYHEVLKSFSPRPVIMRTLDIGGDKSLPYFPIDEENPFLGWRGIRISLDHPEIFLMQLRAMFRANVGLNNLKILLPMISLLSEIDHAKELIYQAYNEIKDEGNEISFPEIGVMIEVPSMIYQINSLSKRVDFLSIGSNDLTQYLLAVDRNNAKVSRLYNSLTPSVIIAINSIVKQAKENQIPISICGEMSGNPMAVPILLGMGIDSLSMNAYSMPRIKQVMSLFSMQQTKDILQDVMEMEDPISIENYMTNVLEKSGLDGLIRAGN